jgi:aminoglycoside phosphotransferase (APT) family kinase protein
MSLLHPDEVEIDDDTIRRLVHRQFPDWDHLALVPPGHGTDNHMLRLGEDLVVRLPRKPGTAVDVAKEQAWLPRLAPHLPLAIPEPVAQGRPGDGYPFPWSVYRWVEGTELDPDAVENLARLGRELAGFIRALQGIDLMGAQRAKPLLSYRGGSLRDRSRATSENFAACRCLTALDIDLDKLESIWAAAMELDEPTVPHTWMHTDIKPSNLLVRDGVLVGVIDFGGLSVGDPTCEHAPPGIFLP